MPVRCDIYHPGRIAIGVSEGVVSLRDLENFLDQLEKAGAIHYQKIFDASFGTVALNEADWTILAAEVGAYMDKRALGPLAVVAVSGSDGRLAERLAGLKSGNRPAKIFRSIRDARRWLESIETARFGADAEVRVTSYA
ncbi:MAG TPA: hypothetical protein VFB13_12225 [Reyranella sp.]|nr:hypothetical protein [Reyranella sp.]